MQVKVLATLATVLLTASCTHTSHQEAAQRRAALALSRIHAPSGGTECAIGEAHGAGMICWKGNTALIKVTTQAFTAELQRVGASDAKGACVGRRTIVVCQVSGTIQGEPIRLFLGPNETKPVPKGVRVSGGLADSAVPQLPHWAPVPL
jgi:hypothetical protein